MNDGLNIKEDSTGFTIKLQCPHQNSIAYIIPSESNWVCQKELMTPHAISGFFSDLVELNDSKIENLMQKWGIYFRVKELDSNYD